MQRFLPAHIITETVNNENFWRYLHGEISGLANQVESFLTEKDASDGFLM